MRARRTRSSSNSGHGEDTTINVGYGGYQALLRFEDIAGLGANQIRTENVRVDSATLPFELGDSDTLTYGFYRMLTGWDETSNWNDLVDGIQIGTKTRATPDATFTPSAQGTYSIDVTSSVQAWANNADNYGWMIDYTTFSWANGIALLPSEFVIDTLRPRLDVEYSPNPEASTFLPLLAAMGMLSLIRRRRK